MWTLGGSSREHRIGKLWEEWRSLGAHLVEDGWVIPSTGMAAFTESGTYAPVYLVGPSARRAARAINAWLGRPLDSRAPAA